LCQPAAALAAPGAGFAPPIGGLLGDIAHAVLGGVDWTVNVAGDFIMNLLGGLVKVLIPRSWIGEGLPGARRDRPAAGTAGPPSAPARAAPHASSTERSNESARNAFGRPPAKPTRTFKQRLTRGRKP